MKNISEFGQRVAMLLITPVLKFFVHFEVRGKENLKDIPANAIYAMNHISELDVVLLPCTFSVFSKEVAIYYVSFKRSVYKEFRTFNSFFYREWLFRILGAYSVELGLRDFEKSLALHIEFLKDGKNVAIFPEGGIRAPGEICNPKGGTIALVKATGLPVVPVNISGHSNINLKEFLLRKRKTIITFGKPIYPDEIFTGYKKPEPKHYVEITRNKIMKSINGLNKD